MFLTLHTANQAGAAGLPAQSGLAARHVWPAAGERGRHRLLGSQRKGPRDRESAQTAPEGGRPVPQGAGEVTGHVEQSAGERWAAFLREHQGSLILVHFSMSECPLSVMAPASLVSK